MTSGSGALVLAHGGGAPEVLTFGLPLVILSAFVCAERRARRHERDAAPEPADPGGRKDHETTPQRPAAGSAPLPPSPEDDPGR